MSDWILLATADVDLARATTRLLVDEGLEVRLAADGATAALMLHEVPGPAAVVLDLTLRNPTGLELCRRIRRAPRTADLPLVAVSESADEVDRVVAFEIGVDDYVLAPPNARELVLRLRAILRRAHRSSAARAEEVVVDAHGNRVWVGKREVALTATEFRVLHAFVKAGNRVLSRAELVAEVWDPQADVTERTIDSHVRRIRQKLGPARHHLQTLRGVGYRYVRP